MELKLHEVSQNGLDDSTADVIFIHGLEGNHLSTWHPKGKPELYWPKWLAEDCRNFRVWSLDYPSARTRWGMDGGDMSIYDRAKGILDYLIDLGIGNQQLLFVAHSLGGLLIKQMLRIAYEYRAEEWGDFVLNTIGVVFISSPHSGSNLANFASLLPGSRASKKTNDLKANNPHLEDLGNWYSQNANELGVSTKAYYETKKTGNIRVVNRTSANPNIHGCSLVGLDDDHLTICKPETKESQIYIGVKKFIVQTIEGIPEGAARGAIGLVRSGPSNPFKKSGTLNIDATSYIARDCDQQLSDSLQNKRRIVIQGEHQIGKSSLVQRIPQLWDPEWDTKIVDFSGLRIDKRKLFMDGFYSRISPHGRRFKSPQDAVSFLEKKPAVWCFDEFGVLVLNKKVGKILISNLDWIARKAPDSLRIVVCLPHAIDVTLNSLGINKKGRYYNDWWCIEIKPFTHNQVKELLGKLPEKIQKTAFTELDTITKLSQCHPKALQCLCYSLWDAFHNSPTSKSYQQIINDRNSYK